jgi:hypothetical protein
LRQAAFTCAIDGDSSMRCGAQDKVWEFRVNVFIDPFS